jgi:molybdenum cofactor biosynthesis protein B
VSHHREEPRQAALALLTVSDSRTEIDDRSGAQARKLVEAAGHRVIDYAILPDDPDRVRDWATRSLARADCDALIVNGGTGISSRDRTYEALAGLLDRRLDGFGELFRMLSFEEIGARSMLSRAMAGISRGKPLFSLPGSPAAVRLALQRLVLPALGHLLAELEKD